MTFLGEGMGNFDASVDIPALNLSSMQSEGEVTTGRSGIQAMHEDRVNYAYQGQW